MRFATVLSLAIIVGSVVLVGCSSSSNEDDGLNLKNSPPPVDTPATGAQPPEVVNGKKPEGG